MRPPFTYNKNHTITDNAPDAMVSLILIGSVVLLALLLGCYLYHHLKSQCENEQQPTAAAAEGYRP